MKRRRNATVDEATIESIPSGRFYGSGDGANRVNYEKSRWAAHLKKLEKIEADFKSNPLTELYKPRLSDPCILRRTFFKQKDAFEFIESCSDDGLHVFSFESANVAAPNSGKRQYLVCSYAQFYHYYRQLKNKHHYEIIPGGAPCRLYFDLEYSIPHNRDRNGQQMIEILIKIVHHKLNLLYNVRCERKDIVDLQATSDHKFSHHLIYHLPEAAFADNVQAGNFVNHICTEMLAIVSAPGSLDSLETLGVTPDEVKELFVKKKDGADTLFCDLGVYTKNRNFRLLHSTKRGRQKPLVVSDSCQFVHTRDKHGRVCPERCFHDTLICHISEKEKTRLLTCDAGCRVQYGSSRLATVKPGKARVVDGAAASPYPDIDAFILSILRPSPDQDRRTAGGIRRWSYFEDGEVILYEIHSYRYCHNVGRHHKSNNIMLVVDLQRGVYYQKCHDADCRRVNFKSEDFEVPEHLLPKNYVLDDSDSDWNNEDENSDRTLPEENAQSTQGGESEHSDPDFELNDYDLVEAVANMEQESL